MLLSQSALPLSNTRDTLFSSPKKDTWPANWNFQGFNMRMRQECLKQQKSTETTELAKVFPDLVYGIPVYNVFYESILSPNSIKTIIEHRRPYSLFNDKPRPWTITAATIIIVVLLVLDSHCCAVASWWILPTSPCSKLFNYYRPYLSLSSFSLFRT